MEDQYFDQSQSSLSQPWYLTWWGIIILLILAFIGSIIVALAFSIWQQAKNMEAEKATLLYNLPQIALSKSEGVPQLGATDPKYDIVIFSDFNCQNSKKEAPILNELMLQNPNEIRITYRDFPVVTEDSLPRALAARCANEQKMFWPMHDYLFDNQGTSTIPTIIEGAKNLNLDMAAFTDCLKKEKYLPQIKRDLSEAMDLKLKGTPVVFINGYQFPAGAIPEDTLKRLMNEISAKAKATN